MKLRKVIFIAPTFVNATGADDISTGKIIQIK